MREAARALDDVSDHLGEVLRRADELLVEWSQFGAQVRAQVERQVAGIGDVVDDAVARAAGAGIDRAVADRLRGLTAELERLEQRARAASRAVVEQRDRDRRVLWILVGGVVLANALLVALLLRKPEPAPVAEPIRLETPAPAPAESPRPAAAGVAEPSAADAAHALGTEPPASVGGGSNAAVTSPTGDANAGSGAARAGSTASSAAAKPGSAAKPPADAGAPRLRASPIALPPKGGRGHKQQP